MALGTNHVIASEVPNFIPELWSDEVVASYKANLVMANLVRILNHEGQKGDTVKIPTPTRGSTTAKAAESEVTLIQHGTDSGISVVIDQHPEYSRLIEDFAKVQALESLRRFYVDDAGYAISKEVDTRLIFEAADAGFDSLVEDSGKIDSTSTLSTVYEGNGTTWDQTASTDLNDDGIRTFIKVLDDNDVPMMDRFMVIPTIVKKDLLGIARFTEQAFVGEVGASNTIRNGLIGDIYGVEVFVTTNLPLVEDDGATADNVLGLMFQRDSIVLVEQLGVRVQEQYILQYLSNLMVADKIFGVKNIRTDGIINFVVPTT